MLGKGRQTAGSLLCSVVAEGNICSTAAEGFLKAPAENQTSCYFKGCLKLRPYASCLGNEQSRWIGSKKLALTAGGIH